MEGMILLDIYIFDDDDKCGDNIDTKMYSTCFDVYIFHIWLVYVCFIIKSVGIFDILFLSMCVGSTGAKE